MKIPFAAPLCGDTQRRLRTPVSGSRAHAQSTWCLLAMGIVALVVCFGLVLVMNGTFVGHDAGLHIVVGGYAVGP